ncbi:MAG TPA: PIG-L family deacetylase [Vicinamibacterales bacterium]|jgi:LmbE family N-acetylglucosaminyl deacetylase|nr:PIG-L family deacetylase [Vicinamibacterales bacterium]
MKRREFLGKTLAGGAVVRAGATTSGGGRLNEQVTGSARAEMAREGEIVVERSMPGRPHQGKVLAAIQPHSDDIPLFAGGTVAKLVGEGYTGCLIRMTNDEKAGRGATTGEIILNNERDNDAVAKALGLTKVFNLNYRNHRMDNESRQEMRGRLIHLFRLLKVDTVVCYDPWGHYEENPDHYVTAQVVESACWMAGSSRDYVEQLAAGLQPHGVSEKYYFARGPQLINRVVDISASIDQKVESNRVNVTQGPAGENGAMLRARLAARKLRLPILGTDDDSANRQYIKQLVLDLFSDELRGIPSDKALGRRYGLEWAEGFHHVGPRPGRLDAYIAENAVPL